MEALVLGSPSSPIQRRRDTNIHISSYPSFQPELLACSQHQSEGTSIRHILRSAQNTRVSAIKIIISKPESKQYIHFHFRFPPKKPWKDSKRSWKHSNLPTHQQSLSSSWKGWSCARPITIAKPLQKPTMTWVSGFIACFKRGGPSQFKLHGSLTGNAFSFSGSFVGNMSDVFFVEISGFYGDLEKLAAMNWNACQPKHHKKQYAEWRFWNYTWKFK